MLIYANKPIATPRSKTRMDFCKNGKGVFGKLVLEQTQLPLFPQLSVPNFCYRVGIRIVMNMNKNKSFRLCLIRFQIMSMRVSEKREVKLLEYKGLRKVYGYGF